MDHRGSMLQTMWLAPLPVTSQWAMQPASGTVAGGPEHLGAPFNWGHALPALYSRVQPLARVQASPPSEASQQGEYRPKSKVTQGL
jgi:hypothetical protein